MLFKDVQDEHKFIQPHIFTCPMCECWENPPLVGGGPVTQSIFQVTMNRGPKQDVKERLQFVSITVRSSQFSFARSHDMKGVVDWWRAVLAFWEWYSVSQKVMLL